MTVTLTQPLTAAGPDLLAEIGAYLARCRELAGFCSQNGWIDNESIEFEIQAGATPGILLVAVKFTEVIMKGAGCEARRLPRFARLRLSLNPGGEVIAATPL